MTIKIRTVHYPACEEYPEAEDITFVQISDGSWVSTEPPKTLAEYEYMNKMGTEGEKTEKGKRGWMTFADRCFSWSRFNPYTESTIELE